MDKKDILNIFYTTLERYIVKYCAKLKSLLKKFSLTTGKKLGEIKDYLISRYSIIYLLSSSSASLLADILSYSYLLKLYKFSYSLSNYSYFSVS